MNYSKNLIQRNLEFLNWLVENFGRNVRYISYNDLSREYGVSHETIRNYLYTLEYNGYLKVDKLSKNKRAIRVLTKEKED
jgi:transcriptional regulator of heat shock response